MKKLLLPLVIGAVCVSTSAFAKTGPYVGADLGLASVSGAHNTPLTFGIKGGYLFQTSDRAAFGPEIGYTDLLADASRRGTDNSIDQINLLGVAKFNLDQQWSLIGKAGMSYVTNDYDPGPRKTNWQPIISAGGQYALNQNIALNAAWTHTFGDGGFGPNSNTNSMDLFTVGATYTF